MDGGDVYYKQQRQEMLQFVPETTRRLVDIGCGEGGFGCGVKQHLPQCEVWGVELVEAAARIAAGRCDKVINAPFDDMEALPSGHFDVVTMNDVLEHLPYPEPALATVKRILKPGGLLVMSLPNVAHYLNVRDLVFRNDWEYQEFGVLDRTHLRFFTQKSAVRTLKENGFEVLRAQGINPSPLKPHYAVLFALLPGLMRPMRFPQFAIVARPA
jgi:ubiquinone/menaquinone biosynthesis C-methylase UbiE